MISPERRKAALTDVGKLRGISGLYASDVSGVVHEGASFAFAEWENFGSEANGVGTTGVRAYS